MKTQITKTNVETFTIEADNETAFNYAKEMVLRGDYIFRTSWGKKIKGDGYSITREDSKPVYSIP